MTFDQTWYAVGTATVNNGSTSVTGQSTNWLTGGIIAGDYFLAAGLLVPISAVTSNTAITLSDAWPGSTRTTASYKIVPASDAVRILTATRAVLTLLTGGNVSSLAGLTLAANKGIHATGAATLATHDQTAFGRALLALTGANGSFMRATGAGTAVMQAIVGAVSQSGGVPTGALMEQGNNANGHYWRFANGLQLCMRFEEPFDVTSLGNQIRPMAASFTLARQFTFVSHCSTTPNTALLYSNIRYAYQDQTNFALRLNAAGTSSDPTSLNEKLTIASIGRWF
jgi:hypothetical protein